MSTLSRSLLTCPPPPVSLLIFFSSLDAFLARSLAESDLTDDDDDDEEEGETKSVIGRSMAEMNKRKILEMSFESTSADSLPVGSLDNRNVQYYLQGGLPAGVRVFSDK